MEKPLPVILRALEPEDLELLYTIENDPEVWDVTALGAPCSRYALKQYVAAQQALGECDQLRLVAALRDGGRAIGIADLTGYDAIDRRAEIGIVLLSSERGKGYGAATLSLIEAYARDRLRLHSLLARTATEGNDAALALFRSAGYEQAGTLKDWHYSKGKYCDMALFQKIFEVE